MDNAYRNGNLKSNCTSFRQRCGGDYLKKRFELQYPYAHYLFNASLCLTAWLTAALAVERYVLVCHAARAKLLCGIVRVRFVVVVIFVVTGLFSLPFAFRYRTVWTPSQVGPPPSNATNATSDIFSTVHIEVSKKVDFIGVLCNISSNQQYFDV